jgi:hypothetical protein
MNILKMLFGSRKPALNKPVVSSRFIVRYTIDGNLNNVLKYECIAESENMARYDFWDTHNGLYHDILSVAKNDN